MKTLLRSLFLAVLLLVLGACGGGEGSDERVQAAASEEAPAPVASEPVANDPDVEAPAEAEAEEPAASDEPAEPEPAGSNVAQGSNAAQGSSEAQGSNVAQGTTRVVYNGDFGTSIAPIFESKCASCHNAGGPGAIHWQLESAADLVDTHQWISSIVDSQYMPPWPAGGDSPLFHDDRSMSADEIAAVMAWSSDGAPLDVEATEPIEATVSLITLDADVEVPPHESYQGSLSRSDDYRCLIYDPQLTETAWMKGYEFLPDQAQVVHHAVGYLVSASEAAAARDLSAADDAGGGYACFGGSRLSGAELFLGWAPGQQPTIYPDGSGIEMEPGDFLVLQIHYHYDIEAPEDASTLAIDWADESEGLDRIEFGEYLGPAEIPCGPDESGPLCDRAAAIALARERFGVEGALADVINRQCDNSPADATIENGIATSECLIPVRTAGEIVSIFGHQHEIGSSVKITLNPGRASEKVLLDIPNWSFDWQLNYEPIETVTFGAGDEVLLECEWDRSLRKPELEPSYILWADGTNDEMCFATITTRQTDPAASAELYGGDDDEARVGFSDDALACMQEKGVTNMPYPPRDQIEFASAALYECEFADVIGTAYTGLVAGDFGQLMSNTDFKCIQNFMQEPDGVQAVMLSQQADSTADERLAVGEVIAGCISFADALTSLGLPIPESGRDCANAAGADIIIDVIVNDAEIDQNAVLGILGPCLAEG